MKSLSIVSIGSGNVATHLIKGLHQKKVNIVQVWSRTLKHAKALAKEVNAEHTAAKSRIKKDADLYLICLPDNEIHSVTDWLPFTIKKHQIIVHTSGSIQSLAKQVAPNNGVLYPLQSFNKNKKINFKEVPVFLNASNACTLEVLEFLAKKLTKKIHKLDDQGRKRLHLSAVILNNFIHHLAYKSEAHLNKHHLDFNFLNPLLKNTFEKLQSQDLKASQTGPARRKDDAVIKDHLKLLSDDPEMKKIYRTISDSIKKTYQ